MSYPLESLGSDRFQRLCQALLVREYPDVKCFPIGQADGGRDAVAPSADAAGAFVVFQVKFTSAALAITDPHKWALTLHCHLRSGAFRRKLSSIESRRRLCTT
jgi:hypothetical protein